MADQIIVVDDDTTNLRVAEHILRKNDFEVTALRSGAELLQKIEEGSRPELVLLDIKMPEMDGFETLRRFRLAEQAREMEETPVIFLTADEDTDTEKQGFEAGVSDYIKKPFIPDVFLRRIGNIISKQQRLLNLKNEATIDKLTGFLNKAATAEELGRMCEEKTGCLMMIDLDSFKLVNDIYSHEMGDHVLKGFAKILSSCVPQGSKCGRIGGDEFVAFADGYTDAQEVADLAEKLNEEITAMAKSLMGEDMDIPLGASVGGILLPRAEKDYDKLLKLADKALYSVKKNGKHGGAVYSEAAFTEEVSDNNTLNMDKITEILSERSISNDALQLDKDSFSFVYRYVIRYIMRNKKYAGKVLFTLGPGEGMSDAAYQEACDSFGEHLSEFFRKTDVFMRCRPNQYFLFLTDIRENAVSTVVDHLIRRWDEQNGGGLRIEFETALEGGTDTARQEQHIVVVDDEVANLQLAGNALSKAGFHVSAMRSAAALFKFLEQRVPDMILMDVLMPEMDGFEAVRQLKSMDKRFANIPIVFLTADISIEAEQQGLELGAWDFLPKPFHPDLLSLRVQHLMELIIRRRNQN